MSATVQTNKNADKGVKLKAGGIAGWKSLNPVLKVILQKLNVQFTVENMEVSETVQGLHLKSTGGGSATLNVCHLGQPATRVFQASEPTIL